MRVIALIDDPGVVRRKFEHLGRWTPEPAERGPPAQAPHRAKRGHPLPPRDGSRLQVRASWPAVQSAEQAQHALSECAAAPQLNRPGQTRDKRRIECPVFCQQGALNMNLVDRAKNILLKPKDEWQVIAGETATVKDLYLNYAMILAAIPVIATFVGGSIIGYGFLDVSYRVPIVLASPE
jgi:hypothetical protein